MRWGASIGPGTIGNGRNCSRRRCGRPSGRSRPGRAAQSGGADRPLSAPPTLAGPPAETHLGGGRRKRDAAVAGRQQGTGRPVRGGPAVNAIAPHDRARAARLVEAGTARYLAARRAGVDRFVDRHFAWRGALRLHRAALGWDVLRAPANIALGLPQFGLHVASLAAGRLGSARAARALDRRAAAHGGRPRGGVADLDRIARTAVCAGRPAQRARRAGRGDSGRGGGGAGRGRGAGGDRAAGGDRRSGRGWRRRSRPMPGRARRPPRSRRRW